MSSEKVLKDLADEWRSAGIAEGDTLLVHSSISRVLRRVIKAGGEASPKFVLESLLMALGEKGTLLLPLFNFDFTKGIPFDIRSSQSAMGSLTEAGRTHPKAIRTGHPIYSFAAIGAQAREFENIDNYSGYGEDSPFAILRELDGKIGVIDLPDQNSMTFYHHVEEMSQVDYRYHKTFNGRYTDNTGNTLQKEYGLFVRDFDKKIFTNVDPMGEILWDENIYSGDRPKQKSGLRVASAKKVFDRVTKIINLGKAQGTLYVVGN